MEKKYLKALLKLAQKAEKNDEAPIAAIIVSGDRIISQAYNRRNGDNSTISHAEISAISKANKKLKDWRLNNCMMFVTIKPCEMCEKVIKEARIAQVYYLLERSDNKKQYDKTEFIKDSEFENLELVEKYKSKLVNFWKNKR